MSVTVFCAVLLAALLHAVWNALVKGGADKHAAMCAVMVGHVPIGLAVLPFVPLPASPNLPWLLAGIALHFLYQVSLLRSYGSGDLTQVYPIARGSAPLIVAGVSVIFLDVALGPAELLAVAVIGAGILSMSLVRQRDGLRNAGAARLALLTGCFIAAYSLVDGTGARLAGTALGFYAWLAILNGVLFALYTAATSMPSLRRAVASRNLLVFGGGFSFLAYALVVWAFTQAPIALVTALRETSIVFALLIGVVFLKERMDLAKLIATMTTLFGAALLRLARP